MSASFRWDRKLGVWGLVFLLFTALAGARPVQIQVESDPPGARIVDHLNQSLGTTGQPFSLNPENYAGSNSGIVGLNLQLSGYRPLAIEIPCSKLSPDSLYTTEVYLLHPDNPLVALRYTLYKYRYLCLALGVGLVSLAPRLFRQHQQKQRQQRVREMVVGSPDSDSLLMQTVGSYLLLEVLGQGGMATVYRGVPSESLDETQAVAVKVIGRKQLPDQQEWNRFRREIDICRTLQHPGIVRLLDYGSHGSFLYLVMELLRGQTLREYLQTHPPGDPRQRWSILEPLFQAVMHAHSQGVVHRDLKPENVMVTQAGQIKVMDFGLAKSSTSQDLTATGSILGTPLYISPEQIQGGELDPRTDQYALGVMVFEALTGELPFSDPDTLQLILKHLQAPAPPPSSLNPQLRGVDEVVLRMLAKDRHDRFPSLEVAAQQLKKGLLG